MGADSRGHVLLVLTDVNEYDTPLDIWRDHKRAETVAKTTRPLHIVKDKHWRTQTDIRNISADHF